MPTTKSPSASASKVCFDLESAIEPMKRKATTSRGTKAKQKRNKKTSKAATSGIGRYRPPKNNEGAKKQPSSSSSRSKSKKGASINIKKIREKRKKDAEKAKQEEAVARKKARKNNQAIDNHPGNIIVAAEENAAAPEDFFWEVESVIGRRVHRGRVEYLIRWKGCAEDQNTWEPTANLCDTAMDEAVKYTKALKQKEKQREEDEKMLFGDVEDSINNEPASGKKVAKGNGSKNHGETEDIIADEPVGANPETSSSKTEKSTIADTPIVDDNLWKWSDADQVTFRDVERINVNDPNAAKVVTEARIDGTPIVLVGHVGWANFATRWLTEKKVKKEIIKRSQEAKISESQAECEGETDKPAVAIDLTTDDAAVVSETVSNAPPDSKVAAINLDSAIAMDVSGNVTKEAMEEKTSPNEPMNGEKGDRECNSITGGKEEDLSSEDNSQSDDLLDLSKNYVLDIKKMIKDIGGEDVPVIKRHYNEVKPIHGKIPAEKFLTSCWPSQETTNEQDGATSTKKASNLYLHQWQFPLSDTAGRKLCHHNNPLPRGIMGEDLLKYWLDLPQCKLDSPLQYIFMGREDTLSKLHKDPGGLAISIAPIVGQKECVLVHRDDGSNCLYHLTASLNDIDLHINPLLFKARIWRTVIQPGEILLMPYSTYHQCRNVTPCLSYSRFHLDTVNLLPFVQSLVNGDAPEIDHEEVLWNLTSELIDRIDVVFDNVQSRIKNDLDEGDLITSDVIDTVNTLRTLRHFIREVARREEIRHIVKGSSEDSDVIKKSDEHNFAMLVDDVDMCLHEFRYRQSKIVPPFKARRGKAIKNIARTAGGSSKNVIKRDMSKYQGIVAFNSSLENNYTSLVNVDVEKHYPNHEKDKVGECLIGELSPGDLISVKLEKKFVKAEVVEILPQTKAAYLSFEDYPSVYDEYQPYELLRLPTRAEIPQEDIKPGLVVIDLSNSNEYRANVQSTVNGPLVRVKLIVSQHEMIRLVSPAMILGRYVPRKSKKKSKILSVAATGTEEPALPCMRPTDVGQIVEVGQEDIYGNIQWGRLGAATVIKVHGEASITHVDVKFILGSATTESMVPISLVKLAPELDPNQGRGRRVVKRKDIGDEGGVISFSDSSVR